jgi:hypothetical protein
MASTILTLAPWLCTMQHRYGLPAFPSLHHWVWKTNPDGEFAMWILTLSCPEPYQSS